MLGDEKTALFVIISDTDDTFNFIVSIMYTQLFNLLCDRADDVYNGRLPIHVRCLLDEFANIGQIPKFEKLIATIRSREISASIILQSKSQLKAIYKDNADTIEGKAKNYLDNLRKNYGDYDFIVADAGDDRRALLDKGAVKQCIRNVVTVLENDPKFKGVICYNMMTDRNDIVKDLGWYRKSPVLTDSDIDHIMLYLEENYSLTTEKKIKSAINVVAMENKYHPIQQKLNSLVWDKKERIKDVLYHFLGADRNVYTYEAMKVLLLGAISRVFRPGTKFEYMLILVGGQGAGKSTFFRFLAMNDSWFTDDLKKLDDENVFRKMQGHLIIELSEMIATASARSIEDIKSFISRQSDIYKVPYETQPKDRPRVCSKLLWKEALHRDYEPKRIELINGTVYKVRVHFKEEGNEDMKAKIKRLLVQDFASAS